MKKFSSKWVRSSQPRKQRKYRYHAPMHIRQKFVGVHLDKILRKEFGKRSRGIRKGDEVRIMRGEFKGKHGAVTKVDLKKIKIYVDNVKRKKVSGQDVEVPIDPSNTLITKMNIDDKKRKKFFKRLKKEENPREKKKEVKSEGELESSPVKVK